MVKDKMIHDVKIVTENTSFKDICALMKKEKIRHVIVKEKDKVTGIITATDIIKVVSNARVDLTQEDYL